MGSYLFFLTQELSTFYDTCFPLLLGILWLSVPPSPNRGSFTVLHLSDSLYLHSDLSGDLVFFWKGLVKAHPFRLFSCLFDLMNVEQSCFVPKARLLVMGPDLLSNPLLVDVSFHHTAHARSLFIFTEGTRWFLASPTWIKWRQQASPL